MQHTSEHHQNSFPPGVVLLLAAGGLLLLPCVLAVVLVRRLPHQLARQRLFWICLGILGILSTGGFLLLAHPWRNVSGQLTTLMLEVIHEAKSSAWSVAHLWNVVRPFWIECLPFTPLVASLTHFLTPRTAREHLLAAKEHQASVLKKASRRAQRQATRFSIPDQVQQTIVLGFPIGEGLPAWIKKRLVLFPTDELSRHGVVIGSSGSGKSETLLRLAVLAAKVLGWQVIYIDGKGDEDAGRRFVVAMRSAGIPRVKLFPAEPYNGWVGTPKAILSRLLAVEEFSDTHYRAIAENLLRLALAAPTRPVKTSAELLARLNLTNEYLLGLYAGHAEEEAYLRHLEKKDPLGVYNRYAALLNTLEGQLDGTWSYDDVDAAYLALDGLALSGIVSGLARYFVEDFAHYAGQRKPKERRVLFIFDDLGAVDANLTNMFERVRARGVSVYVSGQSDRSIAFRGLLQNAERILASATTIILHACSRPHEILARAGTGTVVQESSQVAGEQEMGRSSLRLAEELNVHPNQVMQLPVGEAYVIAHGKAQRVHIVPITVNLPSIQQGASGQVPISPVVNQSVTNVLSTSSPAKSAAPLASANVLPDAVENEQDEDVLQ